ncbi:hypothetical protein [Corynebacterium mayonis]|uniref:hypothetical protein n=1 Tax=Corynebacterium mayonis TaxID=3062461 RepID=UPI0031401BDA
MRRIATAAVAAATALSIVATPAIAQENQNTLSSNIFGGASSDNQMGGSSEDAKGSSNGDNKSSENYEPSSKSTFEKMGSSQESTDKLLGSSVENDKKNGYKEGTTADIIIGAVIAALVALLAGGFAFSQGLIDFTF